MSASDQIKIGCVLAACGHYMDGRPALSVSGSAALAALDANPRKPYAIRIASVGCDEDKVRGQLPGWKLVSNASWRMGPVGGARAAMQALPLIDAFFFAALDSRPVADLNAPVPGQRGTLGEHMIATYLGARLRLGRIIVPVRHGHRLWPWLIDIGFRQPFVDLSDDGNLERVVDSNPSQVIEVAL